MTLDNIREEYLQEARNRLTRGEAMCEAPECFYPADVVYEAFQGDELMECAKLCTADALQALSIGSGHESYAEMGIEFILQVIGNLESKVANRIEFANGVHVQISVIAGGR